MGRHADRRSRVAIPVVAGSTAAALVVAVLSVQGQATAEAPRLSENLVTNSTFEAGTGGWNTQSAKVELSSGSGRDSRRAALLTAAEPLHHGVHRLGGHPPIGGQLAAGDRDHAGGARDHPVLAGHGGCLQPRRTGQQGADRLRTWLRANPDRHGDNHAIAADALAESYPCPPPQEPTP